MIACPKIGDKIITGNTYGASLYYEQGKLKMGCKLTMGSWLYDDSSDRNLSVLNITFLPTTKEVLKELANSKSKDYRIEVIGTISKIEGFISLKDLKIKIFTKENKQIEIKELSEVDSRIEMQYK